MFTAMLKNNRSLSFYQTVNARSTDSSNAAAGLVASGNTHVTHMIVQHTQLIQQAFSELESGLITRGLQYAGNDAASRAGFMAENWHAGTYNLDAAIKNLPTRAEVPALNKAGAADIVVDGKDQYGLKYYKNAEVGAKAQANPAYKDQKLLMPEDQAADAEKVLEKMADRNIKKGRLDAAEIQNDAKDRIVDKIEDSSGAESTPLKKSEATELAKAVKKDGSIDKEAIDTVMEKKALPKKKNSGILRNELKGLGIAAAIGVGVGFTIGFVVSLAQSGVSPESLKMALASGAKSGAESGILSVAGYGIGRTIGQVAASAMEGLLGNLGVEITSNISKMCNMGVVGALTITVFSVYQFVKLKIHGVATREAIMQVGKQALFSLSLLAVSIAAQGIGGGAAGMVVSISVGIIVVLYSVGTAVHQRQLSEKIRVYTIDKCKPAFV